MIYQRASREYTDTWNISNFAFDLCFTGITLIIVLSVYTHHRKEFGSGYGYSFYLAVGAILSSFLGCFLCLLNEKKTQSVNPDERNLPEI